MSSEKRLTNIISFGERLAQARTRLKLSQEALAEAIGTTARSISRWEHNQATPQPYYLERLCEVLQITPETLCGLNESEQKESAFSEKGDTSSSPTNTLALWTVPYARNRHFTGRDDLLEQLAQRLSIGKPHEPTVTRSVALTQQAVKGLGGIGKTQIAIEYAYRAREQESYPHILWVNAASEEAIMTSFLELAQLLPDFAAKEEKDQHKLVAAIKRWLAQCQHPWLLIFDNADDLSLLQEYLPQSGNGRVLLTTRAHAIGALAEPLEVETMGLMEGTHFLLRRTHRQCASDEESNEASNIVIALDGFPLALDQAGAYIEETGCRFGDYLLLYHTHRQTLLSRRGRQMTNYPDSVATTWSLSFQKIEQKSPAAAELLQLCAFLAPDHIPEELLRDGAPHWPALLQQAAANLLTFNQMIEQLLAFSLVKRLTEDRMLSIHRLVQVVQIDAMEPEEQRQWAERIVYAVNAIFPDHPEEATSWSQCLRYLEQVQACDTLIQKERLVLAEAADLLVRSGTYLREHASYTLAQALYQRALAIREQSLGPHHPLTASNLNNLGMLYWQQGKYEEAEPLYVRGLAIREQSLGSHHPLTAASLNNLGLLYWQQGKYEEAEPLYMQALSIREQQSGPYHLETAKVLNNLGILYVDQGKYEEAEPLHMQVLSIREQQLGPHHPLTAASLNNLGILYVEQGKYEEAEPLYVRALAIYEQQLGPQHPLTAASLSNLGDLYLQQDKSEQAEPLLQRALSIQEHTLASHHPDLADTLYGLARLSETQGHLQKAAALYQQALIIREQVYGPHHPKTIQTRESLSTVLHQISKNEQEVQHDVQQVKGA